MDQSSLFAVFVVCSVVNAVYWALFSMDAVGWIRDVMGYVLAFMAFIVLKFVAMHFYQEGLYPSLSLFFWVVYFLEHFMESILWNCLGSIVRARYGKRIDYRKDVIDALIRLFLITAGFCFIMLITLLFAHDLERSVVVLRQISLMLTICSAIAEYTTVVVYGSLLRDAQMILSNRAMMLVMAPPCISLALSLAVCGVPEITEGLECIIFEILHLLVLTGTIAALWYYAMLQNVSCGPRSGGISREGRAPPEARSSYHLTIATRPGWSVTIPVPVRL